MTLLRNIVSDLVEKRLWPVAVVLLLALVAVPIALGGGDDGAVPPPATPAGAAAPSSPTAVAARAGTPAADVTLDASALGRRDRAGKVRDPFRQQHAPKTAQTGALQAAKAAAKAVGNATTGGGTTAGAAPTGSGGSADTTAPSTAKPDTTSKDTSKPKPDARDLYRVTFRFGETDDLKTRHDVPRLTPLPSSERPYLVYLGVLEDGKTAVFLLSSDVKVQGEGRCRPSKDACETVEMRAGDTEVFDVDSGNGDPRQYELDLRSVGKHEAASKAIAAKAHKRQSGKGRKIVQTARLIARVVHRATAADAYRYNGRFGVLERQDPSDVLGAHLPPAPAP